MHHHALRLGKASRVAEEEAAASSSTAHGGTVSGTNRDEEVTKRRKQCGLILPPHSFKRDSNLSLTSRRHRSVPAEEQWQPRFSAGCCPLADRRCAALRLNAGALCRASSD